MACGLCSRRRLLTNFSSAMSPWTKTWRESSSSDCKLLRLPAYVRLSRLMTGVPTSLSQVKTKLEPIKPAPPVTRIESFLFIVFSDCFLSPNCLAEYIEAFTLFRVLPQSPQTFPEENHKDADK